jgi:hypothetical protein
MCFDPEVRKQIESMSDEQKQQLAMLQIQNLLQAQKEMCKRTTTRCSEVLFLDGETVW